MSELALPVVLLIVACIVGLGLTVLEIARSVTLPRRDRPSAIDPITGPKDRIAIYGTPDPFIQMPPHLKTRDEMVAWMTTELPKLTAKRRDTA